MSQHHIYRNLDTTGWFRGDIEIHFEVDWESIRNRFKTKHRREMEAFERKVASWQRAMDEWDTWQALEQRIIAGEILSFVEYIDVQMYRAQADMRRDFKRRFFGADVKGNRLLGLQYFDAMLQAELVPKLRRELARPHWLHPHLSDDEHGGEG